MTEIAKTSLFVVGAVAAVAAAVVGRPGRVGVEIPDQIGKVLFEEFQDPAAAHRLEITEFDATTSQARTFEVAQKLGQWVIPSHNDYPADATENLKQAATKLIGLQVVNVAGEDATTHETFGVLAPDAPEVGPAGEGAGKLVRMQNEKGDRLAELIIGKPANLRTESQESQLHYARIPRQDLVYTVAVDPNWFSTRFEDWMQKDVLQLNAMDVSSISVQDYSVTPSISREGVLSVDQNQRLALRVRWNADDFKWELEDLRELQNGELVPTELLEGEELDKERLDRLKNALADLAIVDVSPKPPVLREGLKDNETEIWNDQEGIQSLVSRGFYPLVSDDRTITTVSSDGEVIAVTKDAVRYTLRFGQIAGAETEGDQSKFQRFVMLTAAVDEESLPPPVLDPVPGAEDVPPPPTDSDVEERSEDAAAAEEAASETSDGEANAADAERDRIIKENQRRQDEYEEKRKQAQDKVDQLNLRFADWYYVISEDVYQDLHLDRTELIAVRESTAEEGFGADALQKLEAGGLQRDAAQE